MDISAGKQYTEDEILLREEGDYLHRALFGIGAPEEVKRQYAAALRTLRLKSNPNCDLTRLKEQGADLEAIEIALRRKDPFNFLTQRFQVICYLVETRPAYFDRFINQHRDFLFGVVIVGWFALRSVCKCIKGKHMIRKYGIG